MHLTHEQKNIILRVPTLYVSHPHEKLTENQVWYTITVASHRDQPEKNQTENERNVVISKTVDFNATDRKALHVMAIQLNRNGTILKIKSNLSVQYCIRIWGL